MKTSIIASLALGLWLGGSAQAQAPTTSPTPPADAATAPNTATSAPETAPSDEEPKAGEPPANSDGASSAATKPQAEKPQTEKPMASPATPESQPPKAATPPPNVLTPAAPATPAAQAKPSSGEAAASASNSVARQTGGFARLRTGQAQAATTTTTGPATEAATEPAKERHHREPRLSLGVGFIARGHTNEDYELFGEDEATGGVEAFVSYDVWDITPALVMAAEVGYGYEEDERSNAALAFDTQLATHHVHAGANLRYKLLPSLQPHVRVAAGVAHAESDIRVNQAGWHAYESSTDPFLRAGVGVTLRTPPGAIGASPFDGPDEASMSVGARLEVGYIALPQMAVDLQEDEVSGAPITTRDVDLGEFGRSGAYLLLALLASF